MVTTLSEDSRFVIKIKSNNSIAQVTKIILTGQLELSLK